LYVGRANVFFLAGRWVLIRSGATRLAYVVLLLLWTSLRLMLCVFLRRYDLMHGVTESTLYWLGMEVKIIGQSASDIGMIEDVGSPTGTLWASNHYTLFDYTVIHLASCRVLRTIVKHDISAEVPVLGPITAAFLARMGCIPYERGSKASGAKVKASLARVLVEERDPVLVFPEGTGTENGPPSPFKRGALALAFALGVPVQPVSLWYSESIGLARESDTLAQVCKMVRYPTQCVVRLGRLAHPDQSKGKKAEEFAAEVETTVSEGYWKTRRGAGIGPRGRLE